MLFSPFPLSHLLFIYYVYVSFLSLLSYIITIKKCNDSSNSCNRCLLNSDCPGSVSFWFYSFLFLYWCNYLKYTSNFASLERSIWKRLVISEFSTHATCIWFMQCIKWLIVPICKKKPEKKTKTLSECIKDLVTWLLCNKWGELSCQSWVLLLIWFVCLTIHRIIAP